MSNTRKPGWLLVGILILAVGSAGYLMGSRSVDGTQPAASEKSVSEAGDTTDQKTLYTCGMHPWIIEEEPGLCPICNMKLTPKRDDGGTKAQGSTAAERKIAYWRAPMNPAEIYDQPGKSAMGMDLVPVYEDEVIGGVSITIDPVVRQNMGIRTATAEQGPMPYTIRTYGHVTYDETRMAEVSPRFGGWIEKLHIDFTGQRVQKGNPLFEIYSPELVTAQEELLIALKNNRLQPTQTGKEMIASVERRLRYYGVPQKEINAIRRSGKTRRSITVYSPYSGIVTHKNAVLGGYVKAGTPVYRVADLSRVWVEAHIFEYELGRVRTGLKASMTLPYRPGKVFSGRVAYVYPYLQPKTRDVVIRLEFDNPDLTLKPEMYADIRIQTMTDQPGIMIPEESVIRSGERNVVFVAGKAGSFSPRNVSLGMKVDGGRVQVLSGIASGEAVVTSGQFLLDSESKLKEAVQKMLEVKNPPAATPTGGKDDFFGDMESEDDFFAELENHD